MYTYKNAVVIARLIFTLCSRIFDSKLTYASIMNSLLMQFGSKTKKRKTPKNQFIR